MGQSSMTTPRWIAAATSILALLLAGLYGLLDWGGVAGPTVYDPSVAVLTVSAIAVIWYTCFTYESIQQSRRRELLEKRKDEDRLFHYSRLIRADVRRLPRGRGAGEQDFRNASLWRESDLTGLQNAASALGETPAEWAADAVRDLRWLSDLCGEIQDTDPRSGYSFRNFPYEEWESRRQRAYRKLRHLGSLAHARRRVARMTGNEEVLSVQGWHSPPEDSLEED